MTGRTSWITRSAWLWIAAATGATISDGILPSGALPVAVQTAEAPSDLASITSTPEEAADLFLRSVRAIRWSAAARLLDRETLDRFRTTVVMIADADPTGGVRRSLVETDSLGLLALEPADVFDRAIGSMIDEMPGLMHALYDRDDDVIGHVPDGADLAHVVYRTTARISGAVPEVKVMQLRRSSAGWRVQWSDELEVLEAALRGFQR